MRYPESLIASDRHSPRRTLYILMPAGASLTLLFTTTSTNRIHLLRSCYSRPNSNTLCTVRREYLHPEQCLLYCRDVKLHGNTVLRFCRSSTFFLSVGWSF